MEEVILKFVVEMAIKEVGNRFVGDMKANLAELGIDADIEVKVNVKNVDLEKAKKSFEKQKEKENTIKILSEDIDNG